jgi:uncharacterized membrane protein
MAKKKRSGKKKHVSVVEQQRQQEAQYRRLFMDKLRNLCIQIKDESLYHLIPPAEKLIIYLFRGAPLKVVAAEGEKIHKRLMEALVKIIKMQQLSMELEVVKGSGETMTYADYLLVGMSLEYHAEDSDAYYSGKEQFAKYIELREEREKAYEKGILSICGMACWVFDDIGQKCLYTYRLETTEPQDVVKPNMKGLDRFNSQDLRLHQKVIIGTHPLEVRKISIDGETHSGIQVGTIFYKDRRPIFHHFSLSLSEMNININSPFAKLGLPVYIQQHALDRMRERIGLTMPAFYTTVLVTALMRREVVPISQNRILIACFADDLKVGYLAAEAVEGIILIRTFLLLTNSGTPEGNKLSKLTGLQINDRKYLAIDTLQGLANSDIAQNKAFCSLMHDAGCGSILELCKKINNDPGMMWLLEESQPKNIIADLITEYMKPNTEEDPDIEDEEEDNQEA